MKETVVLIAGTDNDSGSWDACLPMLREHYRILLFDTLPSGSACQTIPEWKDWSDRLADFMLANQTTNAHLAGYGAGAELAIRYSLRYPGRVDSLILVSWDPTRLAVRPEAGEYAFPVHRLQEIRCPALILAGGSDPTMPVSGHGLALSLIPDCTLYTIPRAARRVMEERPRISARLILYYYKTLKDRASGPSRTLNEAAAWRGQVLQELRSEPNKRSPEDELAVHALDNFRISLNGEPVRIGVNQRNVKRLLLYLVFHNAPSRERICDDLWPDAMPDNARNLLRVSLSHLRKLLGRYSDYPFLQTDRERITLGGVIRCDLLDYASEMGEALAEVNPERKSERILKLLRQTPRTLLHGFYDEWATHLKIKLENQMLELIEWMEAYLADRGEWDRAIRVLETAVGLFPGEERLHDKALDYYGRMNRSKKVSDTPPIRKALRCGP